MAYQLRDYQRKAAEAAVSYLQDKTVGGGGVIVICTGGGKSWVLAEIAHNLNAPVLIFCPSMEITVQNYEKMEKVEKGISSMYSASVGQKKISTITFATIGSVMNHIGDFDVFKYILIDECHYVKPHDGQYERFLHRRPDRKVVGVTATPFRLTQASDGSSVLEFITRTRHRIFDKVLYYCQITELLSKGYLAEMKYHDLTSIDLRNVRSNSTGSDYDDRSLIAEYERSGFYDKLAYTTLRALYPKSGIPRKGILVFTRFTKEAEELVRKLTNAGVKAAIVTGETPKKERERLTNDFRSGKIQVIANVGVYVVGFDYPELDTVIMARPTKSLAVWYQAVGRVLRPSKGKNGMIIDLSGNYRRFGAVADLKIGLEKPGTERWAVFSKGRQLTNVTIV